MTRLAEAVAMLAALLFVGHMTLTTAFIVAADLDQPGARMLTDDRALAEKEPTDE